MHQYVQENSSELARRLHRRRRVEMEMAICIEKSFTLLLTWHVALIVHL